MMTIQFCRSMMVILLMAGCLVSAPAHAADAREEDRKQLLQVFSEIVNGINDQNIDRMVAQMDENATVVWLNAEVSRGHAEIRAYYRKMVSKAGAADAILTKYLTKAKVAAPARFFGDIAVADGVMEDEFFPIRRGPFKLNSNWSVTCMKTDGKWKIVHLHLSTNVFNNELLDEVKQTIWYAAGGGLLAGLVLMFGIGWFVRRKAQKS
jgi:ketosteroid isomerase-like protein